MRNWWVVFPGLVLALVTGCAASAADTASEGDDDETSGEVVVALADVPAVVLEAAKRARPGMDVRRVEKEFENGRDVYDVEGVVDGRTVEVEVDAKGEVLAVEDDNAADDGDPEDD